MKTTCSLVIVIYVLGNNLNTYNKKVLQIGYKTKKKSKLKSFSVNLMHYVTRSIIGKVMHLSKFIGWVIKVLALSQIILNFHS